MMASALFKRFACFVDVAEHYDTDVDREEAEDDKVSGTENDGMFEFLFPAERGLQTGT